MHAHPALEDGDRSHVLERVGEVARHHRVLRLEAVRRLEVAHRAAQVGRIARGRVAVQVRDGGVVGGDGVVAGVPLVGLGDLRVGAVGLGELALPAQPPRLEPEELNASRRARPGRCA